jgi:hypothetical protein
MTLTLSRAHPVLALALILGTVLCRPGGASGQTTPVEPYYAATTQADVPLKAGDMDGYYHVALLDRGRVVRVDAEGNGWSRVAYPRDLPVYVGAAEVRLEEEGRFAVLTRESGLKSVNQAGGFGKSWQRAMPRGEDAAIGTRMRVFSEVTNAAGEAIGYAVAAPQGARAYIKTSFLRRATDAEVKAYLDSLPESDAREGEEDGSGAGQEGRDDTDGTEAGEQVTDEAAEDVSLIEPITRPGDEPDEAPAGADRDDPPAPDGTETEAEETPAEEDVIRIDQAPADPRSRLVGTLTNLSELFNQVQRQDSDTAELDELAGELRRAIAAQGDDAVGERVAAALRQRLQLVEMRIAARDARRELRAQREEIDARYAQIASQIRELETTRGYQFVGRLVRSSVYDGQRLPLMYRIVSVTETVPRTIGYIAPTAERAEALGVPRKLGEIVGVLGSSTLDPDLRLRIVTPTRIDVLSAERLTPLPAGAPEN